MELQPLTYARATLQARIEKPPGHMEPPKYMYTSLRQGYAAALLNAPTRFSLLEQEWRPYFYQGWLQHYSPSKSTIGK